MRADATHRLLLNATLFPAFSIEVSQDKYVRFAVIEDSEPMSYMLRVSFCCSTLHCIFLIPLSLLDGRHSCCTKLSRCS